MNWLFTWPFPDMWWCVCARNDCAGNLIGPFASLADTEKEINQPSGACEELHFAVKGEPPLSFKGALIMPMYAREELPYINQCLDYLEYRERMRIQCLTSS